MDDVRKAAEERAKRPKSAPVGTSFESERQRSKNALVKQLDSMDGRNVRKIGRNAVLKGTNFLEGARSRERHNEVGGHKA